MKEFFVNRIRNESIEIVVSYCLLQLKVYFEISEHKKAFYQ